MRTRLVYGSTFSSLHLLIFFWPAAPLPFFSLISFFGFLLLNGLYSTVTVLKPVGLPVKQPMYDKADLRVCIIGIF